MRSGCTESTHKIKNFFMVYRDNVLLRIVYKVVAKGILAEQLSSYKSIKLLCFCRSTNEKHRNIELFY